MKDTTKSSEFDPQHGLACQAAFLVGSLAVVALALVLDVRGQRVVLPVWGVPLPESCWFKRLTGMVCPGCGLTRSVICLVHGDFLGAWHFNPGGYLFSALVAAQLPYRIAQIWRIRRGFTAWCPVGATSIFVGLAALILLVQWSVRWWGNLP